MGDDKLDPPSTYNSSENNSQSYIEQLEPFCSRYLIRSIESDILSSSDIPTSPSLDLFGETITSSPYIDSPPIGRTTITTPSCSWNKCDSSSSIQQVCTNTDSGFSSWTGGGDSKTRSPPNLVSSYCALPNPIYAPLTSSNNDRIFMFNQSGPEHSTWDPTNLNEPDASHSCMVTNSCSCLSNLPCASELNEELSDRMFVRSMGDMIKNSPTWSTPWSCSNTYPSCAYVSRSPAVQSPLNVSGSYSETTTSKFSPFLSLVSNSLNEDNSTGVKSCDGLTNVIADDTPKTATDSGNLFSSTITPNSVSPNGNRSTPLHRPIPIHDGYTIQSHQSCSSNSSSSLANRHSNSRIWERPNRRIDNSSSSDTVKCRNHSSNNNRPRTVSYTAYLDSSCRKPTFIYRPGSAPLQHDNLFIPEEDSDPDDESSANSKEMKDSHCVHKRRKSKPPSNTSTRRFSQNYSSLSSNSYYTTDIKINGENSHNSVTTVSTNMEQPDNYTDGIYNRRLNKTDQQVNPRTNTTSMHLMSDASTNQCLTNLSFLSDGSVQHNTNYSTAAPRNSLPEYSALSHSINSLPNSPLNNSIFPNDINEIDNNSRIVLQPPMPDVVPRLGLHMLYTTLGSSVNSSVYHQHHHQHHLTTSQPRCSSVPLVRTSLNMNYNYQQYGYPNHHHHHYQQQQFNHHHHQQHHLYNLHPSGVQNPSFSQSLYDTGYSYETNELYATTNSISNRIHLTLLARRLASVGDELMANQSCMNRSNYTLLNGVLFNGIQRARTGLLSFWRFSSHIVSLFTLSIEYMLGSIQLVNQSLPIGTDDLLSTNSNQNIYSSRRRTATYSGCSVTAYPQHGLHTSSYDYHRPSVDIIVSPSQTESDLHRVSEASQTRFQSSALAAAAVTATLSSSSSLYYAYPYQHNYCRHHQSPTSHPIQYCEGNSCLESRPSSMNNPCEDTEMTFEDSSSSSSGGSSSSRNN
uniref:Uncharacterized protein n=1 Tax=Trichobilharzia regenti TaxID=157069 RepID=A0AA85JIE3_TRIRE|nr:unnamed protein product [Trichobilharzia regenti]